MEIARGRRGVGSGIAYLRMRKGFMRSFVILGRYSRRVVDCELSRCYTNDANEQLKAGDILPVPLTVDSHHSYEDLERIMY